MFANCHRFEPAQGLPVAFDAVALVDAECCRHRSRQRPEELLLRQGFEFPGGGDLCVKLPEFLAGQVAGGITCEEALGEQDNWTTARHRIDFTRLVIRDELVQERQSAADQVDFVSCHDLTTRDTSRNVPLSVGT